MDKDKRFAEVRGTHENPVIIPITVTITITITMS